MASPGSRIMISGLDMSLTTFNRNLKRTNRFVKDMQMYFPACASEWPPVTRNYLTRAGDVAGVRAVLTCIFNGARDLDDRTGDGDFQIIEYVASTPGYRYIFNPDSSVSVNFP
ncbi:uncharacterized protein ACLA_026660 [Aspergillus clavatus NRRL 1]|uniref:Uncharacterized protein n=1 Tax=Aspergillus clavatus (strain ATCC 1007 / CBS 513.65 / DSM 816 / NCTC 3887 / NRRL 1 / QM 1276 / 107) TaxID=344612 RepID=A1CQM8_ASPCL|nr:uncharacterized protein ACLA_026660 [Aspergillus clavatus NRRL 1]EAW07949.1 hypothetical protein ACLA_026660 [Aspergillus clavatus NRRL 1]